MSTGNTDDGGRIDATNTPTEPLAVGTEAPEFRLPGAGDDGIREFQLSEYTGTGAVVLVFYAFDFGPAWARPGFGLRDVELLTFTEGVDVFGISPDSVHAHRRFRAAENFKFPLLTDRLATVAERYGVAQTDPDEHPAVPWRAIFAIDDTGTIRYTWRGATPDADPEPDDISACTEWLS